MGVPDDFDHPDWVYQAIKAFWIASIGSATLTGILIGFPEKQYPLTEIFVMYFAQFAWILAMVVLVGGFMRAVEQVHDLFLDYQSSG